LRIIEKNKNRADYLSHATWTNTMALLAWQRLATRKLLIEENIEEVNFLRAWTNR